MTRLTTPDRNKVLIDEFRREGSTLFQYQLEHDAYICVYKNSRINSLKGLIDNYRCAEHEEGE